MTTTVDVVMVWVSRRGRLRSVVNVVHERRYVGAIVYPELMADVADEHERRKILRLRE